MPARGTMQCCMCGQFRPRADFRTPSGTELGMCTSCALYGVDPSIGRRYGITAIEYLGMLISQHHRCAICQHIRPLHIDHCHATGKVRGLVCITCNTVMGMYKDDPDRLRATADYIEENQ